LLAQPELREQFGKAGRQRVLQQFFLERNVGEIRELFDRMLNSTQVESPQPTIEITEQIEVKVG
jgi:hypothetical protein